MFGIAPGFDAAYVFEMSPNASAVVDLELRYVAANRAYLGVVRAEWSSLVGKRMGEALPLYPGEYAHDGKVILRRSLERVVATGRRDEIPRAAFMLAVGEGGAFVERHFSISNSPVFDEHGTMKWILHQIADVTELEERLGEGSAAQSLQDLAVFSRVARASDELGDLRRLFEQAPGFTAFLRGKDHRFELANPAYLRLIHQTSAIIGRTVEEAVPGVREQGFIDLLDEVLRSGTPYIGRGVNFDVTTSNGELVSVVLDLVYQPIMVDGEAIGIFVSGQDITEARRAEQALALVVEEHAQLIALLPQHIWTARPDGMLDSVNDQTVQYFGIPRAELLRDGWQNVVHPEDLAGTVAAWVHSLQTGEPYQLNFRLKSAAGAYRWHLARAVAVRDASGGIATWLGTNTDIDDSRRAHDDLALRNAYEEKLIGIVSHDLRNPLNTMALAVPMLELEPLGPAGLKAVSYLKTANQRAARLISDLLDFASARNGRFPITPAPSNLSLLLKQAVEDVRRVSNQREIALEHVGPAIGRWDEARLSQIIANLVGNAVQHAPPTAAIRVRSTIAGDLTTIEVWNEGTPIPVADQANLFDPFARGKNSRGKAKSVGLGLFIARELARAHGGDITLRSAEGEGITFTVSLPTQTVVAVPPAT